MAKREYHSYYSGPMPCHHKNRDILAPYFSQKFMISRMGAKLYTLKQSDRIGCLINFILCYRYLDLTEEEKEKLKGSYKVARKLEKLENLQDRHVLNLFMKWLSYGMNPAPQTART